MPFQNLSMPNASITPFGPGSPVITGYNDLTIGGNDIEITIGGDIKIHPDGRVVIPAGMSLDDASREFWRAVQSLGMRMCHVSPTDETKE
jgi:hypothetical protein